MGLLSGLGGLGLNNLEGMNLYENPEKPEKRDLGENGANNNEQDAKAKTVDETEFLLEKSFECPVCYKKFKSLGMRAGKGKLVRTESDLRPIYEGIEPLKYEVIMCPTCGCAALPKYWGILTDMQRKNIKDNIGRAFKTKIYTENTYSYEDALERYQMALANSIIKQAKNSERAYICLKAGWLLEAQAESLDVNSSDYDAKKSELENRSDEFLKNAMEGLISARQSEHFPICGMDEPTLDYLIAALSVKFGEYNQAAKLVGNILTSRSANTRIKDKARDLKEEIIIALKK